MHFGEPNLYSGAKNPRLFGGGLFWAFFAIKLGKKVILTVICPPSGPFSAPNLPKNAWDCSGDRFLAKLFLIDFYPKIAARIFYEGKKFPFKTKICFLQGFC